MCWRRCIGAQQCLSPPGSQANMARVKLRMLLDVMPLALVLRLRLADPGSGEISHEQSCCRGLRRAGSRRLRIDESGTTENISISSTPPGAEATVSGLDIPTVCLTPCVVTVKRSADISVAFAKPGYEPQIIPLTKEVPGSGAAGFAGNILLGGVVGMGVDAVTGAALDHKPSPVIVTLQPLAPAPPAPRAVRPRAKPRPAPVAQAGT